MDIVIQLQELQKDLEGRKSKTAAKVAAMIAGDFDPRVMTNPFSSIGVGTGYEAWKAKGEESGFPPLPEGIGAEDTGGFPHFVLSKRDPYFDDPQFFKDLLQALTPLFR